MNALKNPRTIYFAGAIRGSREDAAIYVQIVRLLSEYGHVLTEHVGDANLTSFGEISDDRFIHDRDLDWLREAEFLVAEVTRPSLGVGYEIGKATEWGKKVLCIFRRTNCPALSAMIAGNNTLMLREYEATEDLRSIFDNFIVNGRSESQSG